MSNEAHSERLVLLLNKCLCVRIFACFFYQQLLHVIKIIDFYRLFFKTVLNCVYCITNFAFYLNKKKKTHSI